MVKHLGNFQLMMAVQDGYKLVRLADNDYGLYVKRVRNKFGTPLAARGTREELEDLLDKLGSN